MLDEPEAFHAFAPKWEPIFWELSEHTADELLNSKEAFMQLLAIVRAEGEEPDEFERVYSESLRHLEQVHGTNQVRWYDLLRVALMWGLWRRPQEERERWGKVAEAVHTKEEQKREVRKMFKSGGQAIYEEGHREGEVKGEAKGEARGEAKGEAKGLKNTLIRQGRKRFGLPSQEILSTIQAIVDLDRLESLTERILDAKSWQELFEEPMAS